MLDVILTKQWLFDVMSVDERFALDYSAAIINTEMAQNVSSGPVCIFSIDDFNDWASFRRVTRLTI